jgi:hypothetical protein
MLALFIAVTFAAAGLGAFFVSCAPQKCRPQNFRAKWMRILARNMMLWHPACLWKLSER